MANQPTLTPRGFAQKWRENETKEKTASQEHFIDLCRMLGEPTPNEPDPTGASYALGKAVKKSSGETVSQTAESSSAPSRPPDA